MRLAQAEGIAKEVIARLQPYCSRIQIAGSVRRQKPIVNDIDLVLIPHDLWNLHHEILGLGPMKMSGNKIMRVMAGSTITPVTGTQVDIYVADEATWATLLLIRTGSAQNNIRLCTIAKKRGWHLAANGEGLFDENRQRIAGDSEESIYKALNLPYQEPWERN